MPSKNNNSVFAPPTDHHANKIFVERVFQRYTEILQGYQDHELSNLYKGNANGTNGRTPASRVGVGVAETLAQLSPTAMSTPEASDDNNENFNNIDIDNENNPLMNNVAGPEKAHLYQWLQEPDLVDRFLQEDNIRRIFTINKGSNNSKNGHSNNSNMASDMSNPNGYGVPGNKKLHFINPLDIKFSQLVVYPVFGSGKNGSKKQHGGCPLRQAEMNIKPVAPFSYSSEQLEKQQMDQQEQNGRGHGNCVVGADGRLVLNGNSAESQHSNRPPARSAFLAHPFPIIRVMRHKPKLRDAKGHPITDRSGRVMYGEEKWFSVDNRRLLCLQRIALVYSELNLCDSCYCLCVEMKDDTHFKEIKKFRTRTNGETVEIGFYKGHGRANIQRKVQMNITHTISGSSSVSNLGTSNLSVPSSTPEKNNLNCSSQYDSSGMKDPNDNYTQQTQNYNEVPDPPEFDLVIQDGGAVQHNGNNVGNNGTANGATVTNGTNGTNASKNDDTGAEFVVGMNNHLWDQRQAREFLRSCIATRPREYSALLECVHLDCACWEYKVIGPKVKDKDMQDSNDEDGGGGGDGNVGEGENVYGPFSNIQMRTWSRAKRLPDTLPIRRRVHPKMLSENPSLVDHPLHQYTTVGQVDFSRPILFNDSLLVYVDEDDKNQLGIGFNLSALMLERNSKNGQVTDTVNGTTNQIKNGVEPGPIQNIPPGPPPPIQPPNQYMLSQKNLNTLNNQQQVPQQSQSYYNQNTMKGGQGPPQQSLPGPNNSTTTSYQQQQQSQTLVEPRAPQYLQLPPPLPPTDQIISSSESQPSGRGPIDHNSNNGTTAQIIKVGGGLQVEIPPPPPNDSRSNSNTMSEGPESGPPKMPPPDVMMMMMKGKKGEKGGFNKDKGFNKSDKDNSIIHNNSISNSTGDNRGTGPAAAAYSMMEKGMTSIVQQHGKNNIQNISNNNNMNQIHLNQNQNQNLNHNGKDQQHIIKGKGGPPGAPDYKGGPPGAPDYKGGPPGASDYKGGPPGSYIKGSIDYKGTIDQYKGSEFKGPGPSEYGTKGPPGPPPTSMSQQFQKGPGAGPGPPPEYYHGLQVKGGPPSSDKYYSKGQQQYHHGPPPDYLTSKGHPPPDYLTKGPPQTPTSMNSSMILEQQQQKQSLNKGIIKGPPGPPHPQDGYGFIKGPPPPSSQDHQLQYGIKGPPPPPPISDQQQQYGKGPGGPGVPGPGPGIISTGKDGHMINYQNQNQIPNQNHNHSPIHNQIQNPNIMYSKGPGPGYNFPVQPPPQPPPITHPGYLPNGEKVMWQ